MQPAHSSSLDFSLAQANSALSFLRSLAASLSSLFWLSRAAYNSLTSVSSRSILEFTSESLSDPGEEPECIGVACPPEDARAPSALPAMVQKLLRRPAAKQRPMKPMASLSRFFFFLSSSSEVGEKEQSVLELLSRSLSCARKAFSRFLALYWKRFLSDSLSKRTPRSRLRCLWRRRSLFDPPSSRWRWR